MPCSGGMSMSAVTPTGEMSISIVYRGEKHDYCVLG